MNRYIYLKDTRVVTLDVVDEERSMDLSLEFRFGLASKPSLASELEGKTLRLSAASVHPWTIRSAASRILPPDQTDQPETNIVQLGSH